MKGYKRLCANGARARTARRTDLPVGNLFSIDEEGFLTFRGRVGRQFKLRNGEFINPELLRGSLRAPLVEHVLVSVISSEIFRCLQWLLMLKGKRLGWGLEDSAVRVHPKVTNPFSVVGRAREAGLLSHERPHDAPLPEALGRGWYADARTEEVVPKRFFSAIRL